MERKAHAQWQGNLTDGKGQVSAQSGAFRNLDVTWKARTERAGDLTSPEELIAAALASCYSMAFSNELDKLGHQPTSVTVDSTALFDRVDGQWTLTTINLDVNGRVPGIDEQQFQQAANKARTGCPVSRALAGNVNIKLNAKLSK